MIYLKQQIELNRQFQANDSRHYIEQFGVMSRCGLGVVSAKSVAEATVSSLLDLQEMLSRC